MLRTLVVGSHTEDTPVAADLARQPSYGYDVVGICPPVLGRPTEGGALPGLGTVSDIAQVVHDHQDPADFVLTGFAARERIEVELLVVDAADAVESVVVEGLEAAQLRFHTCG